MKKSILSVIMIFLATSAWGACTETGTIYTACKPGYYLENNYCYACPDGGTSADKNTGGITDCYLPAGQAYSDTAGEWSYSENCYYN